MPFFNPENRFHPWADIHLAYRSQWFNGYFFNNTVLCILEALQFCKRFTLFPIWPGEY